GNANPAGPAGLALPAPMTGAPTDGRGSSVRLVSPGDAPVIVPVHCVGILVAPVATQLFDPAMLVPLTHMNSLASARITLGAPVPPDTMMLLCISTLSSWSNSRNTALDPVAVMIVLLTKR